VKRENSFDRRSILSRKLLSSEFKWLDLLDFGLQDGRIAQSFVSPEASTIIPTARDFSLTAAGCLSLSVQ
jgi:hypothetical protein